MDKVNTAQDSNLRVVLNSVLFDDGRTITAKPGILDLLIRPFDPNVGIHDLFVFAYHIENNVKTIDAYPMSKVKQMALKVVEIPEEELSAANSE